MTPQEERRKRLERLRIALKHEPCSCPDEDERDVIDCPRCSGRLLEREIDAAVEQEREACAEVAEPYGLNRPIAARQPPQRVIGRYEGECAASSNIARLIRSRSESPAAEGEKPWPLDAGMPTEPAKPRAAHPKAGEEEKR